MKKESSYEFRKKLLRIHEHDIRDRSKLPSKNELELKDGLSIFLPSDAGEVVKNATFDFADFLKVSMKFENVFIHSDASSDSYNIIIHSISDDNKAILGEADKYKGFAIDINNSINVYGHDERGISQALYYLEDVMSILHAPFIEKGITRRYAMFYPQMVHSGYGLDEYPDEYLSRIAHEGRDAILVFTKAANETPSGYLDFNDLIDRAAKYGIDVYAYSYMKSEMSPLDPSAEEYYDGTYGKLFRECPKLKGVVLVGESVEFPSNDPHVFKGKRSENNYYGIPMGLPTSGWYPCEDYPQWLDLIKKVIYKQNKDADIVFWTYNWGGKPEEARIKLIENLPKDITLQATYEMFEPKHYGKYSAECADYTISYDGPGKYFESEAIAAQKRGIRLYSMTNTGGLTWDFGVIPYIPVPYQWIKRYETMLKAKAQWGLIGIMECHHYGFYPSFISKISKWAFSDPSQNLYETAEKIIQGEFGEENFKNVNNALTLWSKAIKYHTPNAEDQYGAFRIGPSHAFCLDREMKAPSSPDAMFGNDIYSSSYYNYGLSKNSLTSLRIHEEIRSLKKMYHLLLQGIELLENLPQPNEKTYELLGIGKFMLNTTLTGIHAKQWYVMKCDLRSANNKSKISKILDDMEKLLEAEKQNAENTIPIVEYNSRLGWEPSMLYVTDKWHIEWKIKQLQFVLKTEIENYRKSFEKS